MIMMYNSFKPFRPFLTTAGQIVPGVLPWTAGDETWIFIGKQDSSIFFSVLDQLDFCTVWNKPKDT